MRIVSLNHSNKYFVLLLLLLLLLLPLLLLLFYRHDDLNCAGDFSLRGTGKQSTVTCSFT